MAEPRFPSIEEFYSNNEVRRRSPEADYGVWWTEAGIVGYWRVSYIQHTGEVYATLARHRHGGEGPVLILGVVPGNEEGLYYTTLDSLLEGWAGHARDGLPWVRERLWKYPPPLPPVTE